MDLTPTIGTSSTPPQAGWPGNYLVSGLLHDASIVLYDGSPSYPDLAGSWFGRVAHPRHDIQEWAPPTLPHARGWGVRLDHDGDLSSVRSVIPTGSPLPPSGWRWLHHQLGSDVRIDPIAGGTDVCTAFIGGSPLLPVRVGEIPCRWLGNGCQRA